MRVPFVIVDMGACHDGNYNRAEELVQLAKDSDADAIKMQWFSSAARVCERMHCPENLEVVQKYQWPREWLKPLSAYAHELGLEFLCTVDCPEDIAVVAPYVDRFKIASWGASDVAFIKRHRGYTKPLIISTGLGVTHFPVITGDEDSEDTVPLVTGGFGTRTARHDAGVWRLHCVSAYPAPCSDLNLAVIRWDNYDGFSDHSGNVLVGALAVAAGAKILEVHARSWHTDPANPDAPHSHTPHSLREYIANARLAAVAMGDGIKRVMPSEENNRKFRYV